MNSYKLCDLTVGLSESFTVSITEEMITGYDSSLIGTQTLTVTYGGQTDTFNVTVIRRPVPISVTIISIGSREHFLNSFYYS